MLPTIYLPPNYKTDGCTFPFWLLTKPLRFLLGADRYTEYCYEHDFLRIYRVIKFYKADWLLARRIFSDGWRGKLRAPFYFIFVFVTYQVYRWYTHPLPRQWQQYADHYRN